ncbi:unnamed protein product [Caenorhabditis nigoni]
MILLYKTFIRPLVEYGTSISYPPNKKEQRNIESIQNSFTRRLYSRNVGRYITPQDPDYINASERNLLYGLSSLEHRRQTIDKKLISKIMLGKVCLNQTDFFQVSTNNRTRSKTRYKWKRAKTKIRQHFFVNRTLSRMS